jgi:hypothetical protein
MGTNQTHRLTICLQYNITVLGTQQTLLVLPGSIPEREGWLFQKKLNEKWKTDISRQICSRPLTEKKVSLFRDFYREVDLFRNSFWMFNFCWWNLRDKPFEKCRQTPHLTLFTFLSICFFLTSRTFRHYSTIILAKKKDTKFRWFR